MVLQTDNQPEQQHERNSRSNSRRHRKSHKPSLFSKITSGLQSILGFFTGSRGHKRRKSKRPLSDRIKYRFEEFKAEFTPPERLKRGRIKHEPLWKRIKSRLKEYKDDVFLPRIKKEKIPKPKLSVRIGQRLDDVKEDLTFRRLFPKVGEHIPMKAKIAYFRETTWKKYSVIFTKDFLIISLNSLVLFLCAFYVVHFLTQLITGVVCTWFNIQTVLYYGITEYHFTIKSAIEGKLFSNKWTLTEILVVFSSAPIVCLILAIFSYRLLHIKRIKFSFKWISRKFKKLFANRLKKRELKIQEAEDPGRKVKLSKYFRLFLIWFICHAFTYFFSGMLFSWMFFMRFGYVTGYIFDSYFFDNLAASLSLISMILLGFLFVSLFLHSSRMYFNQLVDWTRMPFVYSQIVIPCIIGLPIIVLTLLPKILLKLAAMQICMVLLILPLMWRGRIYPEVQFDYKPRTIIIPWKWIISCLVISAAIIISLKLGIKIR